LILRVRLLDPGPRGFRAGRLWLALLVLGGAALRLGLRPGLPCPFHEITGHPCPTCGSTRSLEALAWFRPGEALGVQPLATLLFVGLLLWGLVSLLGREPRLEVTPRERSGIRAGALLLVASNWAYLWLAAGI
jgi:hypothetical protein